MSRLGMRTPTVVRTKSLQAMGPKERQRGASRESPRARRGHTGRSLQGSTGTEAARCPGRTSIPGAPGGPKTGAARLPGRSSIPGGQGGTLKGSKDWGRPLTRQIQQSREGRFQWLPKSSGFRIPEVSNTGHKGQDYVLQYMYIYCVFVFLRANQCHECLVLGA